jgi:hypothetical protein
MRRLIRVAVLVLLGLVLLPYLLTPLYSTGTGLHVDDRALSDG